MQEKISYQLCGNSLCEQEFLQGRHCSGIVREVIKESNMESTCRTLQISTHVIHISQRKRNWKKKTLQLQKEDIWNDHHRIVDSDRVRTHSVMCASVSYMGLCPWVCGNFGIKRAIYKIVCCKFWEVCQHHTGRLSTLVFFSTSTRLLKDSNTPDCSSSFAFL